MERWEIQVPVRPAPPRPARRPRRRWMALLVAVLLGVSLRLWVIEVAVVEGKSMLPTLHDGDRVLVLKTLIPRRFDTIVFRNPKGTDTLIKRVVGLPTETVSMIPRVRPAGNHDVITRAGQLYVDSVPYDEPYAISGKPTIVAPWQTKPGRYYVMGDNRDDSVDSRAFAGVPAQKIHGVAYTVVWPLSRIHLIQRDAGHRANLPDGR